MTDTMLTDAAERMFADLCDKAMLDAAEDGAFPSALWNTVAESGFHQLAMPDSGVSLGDAFAVVGIAGRHALPLPLAETLLANRWLAGSDGLATIGQVQDGWIVDAPWGRAADRILGLDAERGACVVVELGEGVQVREGANLAGEPRDAVALPDGAEWLPLLEPAYAYLALARAVASAGCLARVLELTLQYAGEREQFGRAISRFQAIQHSLAVMAGEVAAAGRAADAAVDALDGDRLELEVAVAKARVGEAAGVVAEIAHQVHGAMGFTHEHQLHHFTRRAWAWRDEFGNETHWQRRLGRHLAAGGADGLWAFIATRG
ncbi:MAG: acyl-CoA dehydrogenase [Gammaproteobacteria bacterium]|nr:acyl-CoA dehydrogenase [Gammaproteobacteria bacterium]|tara:strand:+ start:1706 stop:2662 length:957 start_codon:yes stop_codon:yes gene_type:complete